MQRKSFKLILFIILALSVTLPGISGCSQPTVSTTSVVDYDLSVASLSASQGGNLHYQNIVLPVGNKIAFNSFGGQFCLAEIDGTVGLELVGSSASSPVSDEDQIFYTEGLSSGLLTKISLDGTNHVRIGSKPLKYLIAYNKLLYAIDSETGSIISLKEDGTDRKVITEYQAGALALSNGRLFVTGASAQDGLVMIDLATDEKTVLLNQRISSLNVSGDWLYYSEPETGYRLTAWSIQSKSGNSISNTSYDNPFIVSQGYLYYINTEDQKRLVRRALMGNQSIDDQTPQIVIDDAVAEFVICDQYVFYKRPSSNRIYRVNITGGQPLRIT